MSLLASHIHSALGRLLTRVGVRSVIFEATLDCNQDCVFCYNVWKCADYPRGQLDTAHTKELLDRVIRDYRPQVLTFSGGEPLLRSDLLELVRHATNRVRCNIITNGTLMTDGLAKELVEAGIRTFEFTLLSADRDIHNALARRDSFDRLIEGIASVRVAGGSVTTTFVATKQNIDTLSDTLELNAALGVYSILFNRFNVGGAGIYGAAALMPSPDQVRTALAAADEAAERYGMAISCGVPIPPCVIDTRPYMNIHFVDCVIGARNTYPTVDPMGNVRYCNHSPRVLGNIFETPLSTILQSEPARLYATGLPDECLGCEHAEKCRGGCRAAADVIGNSCGIDPFVHLCKTREEERCAMSTCF